MSSEAATSPVVSGPALRYAAALFDLARDESALDRVEADLKSLRAAIDGSPDFRAFLISPVYDSGEKARAIAAIADKAGVSALTKNFLGVIAKNRRLFALQDILTAFRKRLAEHRGEVTAEAVSAAPLNDDQTRRLRGEIERRRRQGGQVERDASIPNFLAALIVKVGSKMID